LIDDDRRARELLTKIRELAAKTTALILREESA
jgi:hypothetical protein